MTDDTVTERQRSLPERLEELERQYEVPEADPAVTQAWDDFSDGKIIEARLPKLAWDRLFDTLSVLPMLSVQASTLAVLVSRGEEEQAEDLAIKIARSALIAQRNVGALRALLMTLTTEAQDEQ